LALIAIVGVAAVLNYLLELASLALVCLAVAGHGKVTGGE